VFVEACECQGLVVYVLAGDVRFYFVMQIVFNELDRVLVFCDIRRLPVRGHHLAWVELRLESASDQVRQLDPFGNDDAELLDFNVER